MGSDPRGVVGYTCVKARQSGLGAPDASGYDPHHGDVVWVSYHEGASAISLPKHINVRSTNRPSFTPIPDNLQEYSSVLILRFIITRLGDK